MIALFPGQGSQHVGMGKSLFENFKLAQEIFEEASDATHVNLKRICFDGPESELTLTENTQPCLVTVEVAALRVTEKEFGFKTTLSAGHSLGEYSALVASGAISFSSAVRWVKERGRLMQTAVPAGQGTMAAILGLEPSAIEKLCSEATAQAKTVEETVEEIVEPANFNAPGQVVIAGSVDAVQAAIGLIGQGKYPGGKAIPLSVSAPFHCKLMAPARKQMEAFFKALPNDQRPRTLQAPYVPNRTARLTSESSVVLELLVDQIDHPVLWTQTIEGLIAQGHHRAIEFGPGKVLQGLCKRIGKQIGKSFEVSCIGDLESLRAHSALLGGIR